MQVESTYAASAPQPQASAIAEQVERLSQVASALIGHGDGLNKQLSTVLKPDEPIAMDASHLGSGQTPGSDLAARLGEIGDRLDDALGCMRRLGRRIDL